MGEKKRSGYAGKMRGHKIYNRQLKRDDDLQSSGKDREGGNWKILSLLEIDWNASES